MATVENLANSLEALFEGDDRYLLLVEDEVRGEEGVYGLQLIANCLCAAEKAALVEGPGQEGRDGGVEDFEDDRDSRWGVADIGEPQHPRLVHVASKIRELIHSNDDHFVLAFHIAGTEAWRLAYSQGLKDWEAIAELTVFVQSGLSLYC